MALTERATGLGRSVREMARYEMARYWSRDGRTEIDLMVELDNGTFLFGECKWHTERVTWLSDLKSHKAAGLTS